jgi:hypothetical protein
MNIEDLVQSFQEILPQEDCWPVVTLIPGRLHLSKSSEDQPAIFLEGDRASFGVIPAYEILQHSDEIVAMPSGERISALRVMAGADASAVRPLAHIVYEMWWELSHLPEVRNDVLLQKVEWLFSVLGPELSFISEERQIGLVGELLFLRRLLLRCHQRGRSGTDAVSAWHASAKRDFYMPGVAVEVKTTAHVARLHHIASLDQLASQEHGERVYLFSVGIRRDSTAPKKLIHFIKDVEALLEGDGSHGEAVVLFRKKLASIGISDSNRESFTQAPGFLAPHLPPHLFDVSSLRVLTVADFVNQRIPETVRSLSYTLEVIGPPVSETDMVLDRMLDGVLTPG